MNAAGERSMLPDAQPGQRSTTVASTNWPWSGRVRTSDATLNVGLILLTMDTDVAPAVGTSSVLVGAQGDNEVRVLVGSSAGSSTAVGIVVGS